jgi:preprotein translocase subunit SecE
MASASEAAQQANRSGMDPKRLVVIFYMVFGIILALFLDHVLDLTTAELGWRNPEVIEGLGWKATTLAGFVIAIGLGAGAWTWPKSKQLSIEVASELMKVTWPTWAETRVSTMAVVIASLIAAIILFGIDTLSYKLMVDWLPFVWGKL